MLPEVFASGSVPSAAVRREIERGEIRKIAPRLYTPNQVDTPDAIIGRNLWQVISLFPGTVVSEQRKTEKMGGTQRKQREQRNNSASSASSA